MKLATILVFCYCAWASAGSLSQLRALKARLAGRHQKRGVLGSVPTYKVGHDIPVVTHSLVKPVVVTYPPTATVSAVKVPLSHPFHRHPHPHNFYKHHHHKTTVFSGNDQHYHHHHHHVSPKPVVPVLPAPLPVVPIGQPTTTIARPLPPPVLPAPVPPVFVNPAPVVPAPPLLHRPAPLTPLLPAAFPAPVPVAPQLSYVLRPGNAVQTSYFASYPRYPLASYQPHSPALVAPQFHLAHGLFPQGNLVHQHAFVPQQAVIPQHVHQEALVPVEPPQTVLHAHPEPHAHLQSAHATPALPLDHNGWAPLAPDGHNFAQEAHHHQLAHDAQHQLAHEVAQHQLAHEAAHHQSAHEGHHQIDHESAHHTEDKYHEYQQQLQHHIQEQLEQAQYEHDLHHQHQENGNPQQHEYHTQQQLEHEYHNQQHLDQNYHQQVSQDFSNQHHLSQEYGAPEHNQDIHNHQFSQEYGAPQHLNQEYGTPEQYQQEYQLEGRSGDGTENPTEGAGEELRYHNHIPLGLQPPIDRPLEHFQN